MSKYFVIVFLFLYLNVSAKDDYRIISSTRNSLIVEYTPRYLDTSFVTINSIKYLNSNIYKGFLFSEDAGFPQIPKRIINIGVPSEFGNTIKIISSKYEVVNAKLLPVPVIKKEGEFSENQYLENENYSQFTNPELVTFGDFGLVRDLNVQSINIHPVQFYPLSNEVKLYSKIVFQVTFSKKSNLNELKKSDLTNNIVINQKVANKWGSVNKISKKSAVKNSVLSEGDWFRFEAPEEGIYKIDRTFLESLGINVNLVDPRTIKIYNNGGYILSWTPSANRPSDLVENAIIIIGESDGKFDANDYILFYGRGVDFWEYNKNLGKITRNKHFYSKQNYYWLTFGGIQGKRMETQSSIDSPPDHIQNTTIAFKFRDEDNQNLMGSGLLYVGDDYSNVSKSKTYTNTLNNLLPDSSINYTFQFVNGSRTRALLTIDENNNRIFNELLIGPSTTWIDYRYGALTRKFISFKGTLPDSRSVLKFTFTPPTISDRGHLDFFEIQYYQNLSPTENELIFFSKFSDGITEYQSGSFSVSSDIKVFNISDFSNVKLVNAEINAASFKFKSIEDSVVSKYYALHVNKYKAPVNGKKMYNSNIRGISPGAKYIIITDKQFSEQVERLKNYRTSEAKLKVSTQVVFMDELLNEFSCGMLDPTAIRDFLMFAYQTWEIKPEYVLLFGDGDYDYFNLEGKGLNFIPTFQTVESMYEINSYPFDDFYSRISGDDRRADLAIGRLSITNQDEAEHMVDKIITYETKLDKGLWRNKISLLADDGLAGFKNGRVTDDGSIHTRQSERLSFNYIPENFQENKIYLSNYKTINTGSGRRKPDCNAAIIEAMNNGTLLFNYIGHGNPDVWAHERVFERNASIPQLRNKEYFFLTAATCDFGKYDDPNLQSASEEMILMEDAGMIGGLTAVRPVFSSDNAALNEVFYSHMLGERDSNGYVLPIGNAYMKLKQIKTGRNDEKFHLLCDPYLRLNIPELPVKITSVNNNDLSRQINIKALSKVNIAGKVLTTVGSDGFFNGEGIISVFDSKRTIRLEDIKYNMEDQGGVIFRGRVSVNNGEFATSFTVPKDISYENRNGKIVAYFFNDETDGVGFTDSIIVGGTDSTNSNDGKGPEIEILFDDETESSYLVSPNFKLRVKLFDETGLNTTGLGIGHKLEAILNDDEQSSIDLTDFFIGDLNSGGTSGEINYNFSSLEQGDYKIKINAWDVYNNFGTQENYFTVVSEDNLVVREVYNYPNPFSSNTYFTFQHNLNNLIDVKIKIYTIAGRVIKTIERSGISDKFVKIEWDGKDEDNNKIANGTYLYKLILKSDDGKYKENILGKMAVIR